MPAIVARGRAVRLTRVADIRQTEEMKDAPGNQIGDRLAPVPVAGKKSVRAEIPVVSAGGEILILQSRKVDSVKPRSSGPPSVGGFFLSHVATWRPSSLFWAMAAR
jgi:hypothetical protein